MQWFILPVCTARDWILQQPIRVLHYEKTYYNIILCLSIDLINILHKTSVKQVSTIQESIFKYMEKNERLRAF